MLLFAVAGLLRNRNNAVRREDLRSSRQIKMVVVVHLVRMCSAGHSKAAVVYCCYLIIITIIIIIVATR